MLKYILNIAILLSLVNIAKAQTPDKQKNGDNSLFTITAQSSMDYDYAQVSIYANDKNGELPMLAMVGFRDQKNKLLANIFTDKAGFAHVNLYDFSKIAYLTVDYIGYDAVKIPVSKLKRKITIIRVLLKGQGTEN